MSIAAEVMQRAFEADPNAMHSLVCIRVPCNQALADDPHVIVDRPPVLAGDFWQVGILGVLNGVLSAHGLPEGIVSVVGKARQQVGIQLHASSCGGRRGRGENDDR